MMFHNFIVFSLWKQRRNFLEALILKKNNYSYLELVVFLSSSFLIYGHCNSCT